MKDWTGFWESDTHELKQISEETGVTVDKFQDIYETMYPNIHKWAWYHQTLKDLRELREPKPTAYDIAHGLKTTEDVERYNDLQAEIDKLKDELNVFCTSFNMSGGGVRLLPVETPDWLKDVPGVFPCSMFILRVLCSFNRYLLEKSGYGPGVAIPVEGEESPKWWKFWDYSVEPQRQPWNPPCYVNRLILAFGAYLDYQGIQYRPYLDDAHAFHHWTPPKECEYEANF